MYIMASNVFSLSCRIQSFGEKKEISYWVFGNSYWNLKLKRLSVNRRRYIFQSVFLERTDSAVNQSWMQGALMRFLLGIGFKISRQALCSNQFFSIKPNCFTLNLDYYFCNAIWENFESNLFIASDSLFFEFTHAVNKKKNVASDYNFFLN